MQRVASAEWIGTLKDGIGKVTLLGGGILDLPYSYDSRFKGNTGTSPEEWIAAAHASCFNMSLSEELEKLNLNPTSLHTDATVTIGKEYGRWSVTQIHLDVFAVVPGVTLEDFHRAATIAKAQCPMSRLLDTEITLEASLLNKPKQPTLLIGREIHTQHSNSASVA